DRITQAKRAFEADTAETDSMQSPFVGISEAAERCEMLFSEVFTIVGENEVSILNTHRGFCCSGVVRVLKKLRKNMPGALHLPEKLMPRPCQFRISVKFIP